MFKVDSTLRCFQIQVAKLERTYRHVRADLDKLFVAIAVDPRVQKHATRHDRVSVNWRFGSIGKAARI